MAFISLTRLRLRSIRFLPRFAVMTLSANRQVRAAPGFLGGELLPDRRWTFWTLTAWTDSDAMRAYMTTGSHRKAMPYLLDWCDEASVAHWTQEDARLPDWAQADARMRAQGRPSKVRHPGPDHLGMTFAPARTTGAGALTPAAGASR